MAKLMGDADTALVVNALRMSARQYEKDADVCARVAAEAHPNYARLVEQFRRQAQSARQLADRLEGQ